MIFFQENICKHKFNWHYDKLFLSCKSAADCQWHQDCRVTVRSTFLLYYTIFLHKTWAVSFQNTKCSSSLQCSLSPFVASKAACTDIHHPLPNKTRAEKGVHACVCVGSTSHLSHPNTHSDTDKHTPLWSTSTSSQSLLTTCLYLDGKAHFNFTLVLSLPFCLHLSLSFFFYVRTLYLFSRSLACLTVCLLSKWPWPIWD